MLAEAGAAGLMTMVSRQVQTCVEHVGVRCVLLREKESSTHTYTHEGACRCCCARSSMDLAGGGWRGCAANQMRHWMRFQHPRVGGALRHHQITHSRPCKTMALHGRMHAGRQDGMK